MAIVEIIGTLIMASAIFCIIGAFFAIPIALPFIRRRAKANQTFRVTIIAICSLVALILPTLSVSYLGGKISVIFACVGGANGFDSFCNLPVDYELRDEFEHELGMRSILPPPLRRHCFTDIPEVCMGADEWYPSLDISWAEYLSGWLVMSIIAFSTAIIGWALTPTLEKEKRKNSE